MRHETFRTADFYALLRRHEVALVLADNPGQWPIIDETTADLNYVRLHGHEELYASGYSDEALDAWAAKISAGGTPGRMSTSTATTMRRSGPRTTRWV